MSIEIDKNHLLTIFNEDIPQTKEYTYNVSGYTFSDYDKEIIVLHKKERKIINLKNLGDTMSVCYVAPRKEIRTPLDKEGFIKGLCLFESFDEDTGKKYYFLPKFAEKDIGPTNVRLQQIGIQASIGKTEKGCIVMGDIKIAGHRGEHASFLFALVLLYGKMDIKNNELISAKIHIPLFGQFLRYEEQFEAMKKELAKEGIFINTSTQKNNEGIVYQISCNDYELLNNFATYAKDIEKIDKITKYDHALEHKELLLEFIANNTDIPSEGKAEVMKKIREGTIKFLMK